MPAKRLKFQTIANTDEFLLVVNQIADFQASVALLGAERDRELQNTHARYAARLTGLDDAIAAKLAQADTFARNHRAELLPKGRKSLELAQAVCGFRIGNRTVKLIGRKTTPGGVIAQLKAAGLTAYVRTTEEIAKDRILVDAADDATLPLPATADATAKPATGSRQSLASLGLAIARAETFYVESKVASSQALKPAEAA